MIGQLDKILNNEELFVSTIPNQAKLLQLIDSFPSFKEKIVNKVLLEDVLFARYIPNHAAMITFMKKHPDWQKNILLYVFKSYQLIEKYFINFSAVISFINDIPESETILVSLALQNANLFNSYISSCPHYLSSLREWQSFIDKVKMLQSIIAKDNESDLFIEFDKFKREISDNYHNRNNLQKYYRFFRSYNTSQIKSGNMCLNKLLNFLEKNHIKTLEEICINWINSNYSNIHSDSLKNLPVELSVKILPNVSK